MQIYGPSQVSSPQPIPAPHHKPAANPAPKPSAQTDRVDISEAAQRAAQIHEIPDIRTDKVAAAKAAIAEGTYDTDAKMNVALDRLLDEIG
ncbi:MAG: flagellar biosynthesis anti-sigma factor FlgM [Planctomycetes bacterium]|nr:flagellar biosynthesis anti-sigma factor FlgM [Planctomycetota bacterium]